MLVALNFHSLFSFLYELKWNWDRDWLEKDREMFEVRNWDCSGAEINGIDTKSWIFYGLQLKFDCNWIEIFKKYA